jgi:hypothetical protein
MMPVSAVINMHCSVQAVVIILQITVSTQGKSIEDIRPWILGAEGSNVTLAIRRGGNQLSGALLPRMQRHFLFFEFSCEQAIEWLSLMSRLHERLQQLQHQRLKGRCIRSSARLPSAINEEPRVVASLYVFVCAVSKAHT